MTNNKPYFTIIIPTYNRAHLIGKTLKSVLAQTFSNYEVIVVDDGGKDNTKAVVDAWSCDRFKYYSKENGERGAARNFGWQKANGHYVTFLDSDDILYPDHLKCAHDFISKFDQKGNLQCYAQAYEVKRAHDNRILVKAFQSKHPTINEEIVKGNKLSCFGVFLKREMFEEARFEEDRRFAGSEDWLLWLQLAARYPFFYNNAVTGALLEHDDRSVLSFNEQSLLFRTEFLKEKLELDTAFKKAYGNKTIKKIYAHMLTYTSLHLAMARKRKEAFQYLIKAMNTESNEAFTRRGLAIVKHIFS